MTVVHIGFHWWDALPVLMVVVVAALIGVAVYLVRRNV